VLVPRPVDNPPNPWSSTHVEYLEEPPTAQLMVYEERARSILAENDSPDLSFRWSVNPYRGCFHACAYCYARPSHQLLGFGAGTDFERRIVVKTNAPELLHDAFSKPGWRGEHVTFSGNTDCYQPLEASYGLTRRLLEVCVAFRNPACIITKGALVERDVDVLAALAECAALTVWVSIPFADDETGRAIEPFASSIARRFHALEMLAAAGVPVGVAVAPVIPGLNDASIPAVLERARAAGARHAFMTLVRLPAEVRPVFVDRVREVMPLRAEHVLHAIRDVREGKLNESQFGRRMHGEGPRWKAIETLFEAHRRRLGFVPVEPREGTTFTRPRAQLDLFGE
jgi:DNA repair photolyase